MAKLNRLAISFLATCIILPGIVGCGENESEAGRGNRGPMTTLVDVATVEAQDIQVTIRSVGSLEAVDRVEVASEIKGIIKEIHFRENQHVEKGDLLVQLDDRKLALEVRQAEDSLQTSRATVDLARATVKRAEADLVEARSVYERDKRLFEDGIASESTFIGSKASSDSAAAAVEEAGAAVVRAEREVAASETLLALSKEHLSDASIVAPLSGVLGERLVSPGDYADSGQPLVELIVMDPLEIAFSVPGKHRGRIKMGQTVIFSSPSVSGRDFSGVTTYMSPTADASTRSIKLKARLSNEDNLLQPGLFGSVRLVLETRMGASVIPEAAVVPRGDETFVYMVSDSKALLRKVILGEHLDGKIEVLEGASVGETVIVAGQQKVADGFPVRLRGSSDGGQEPLAREDAP